MTYSTFKMWIIQKEAFENLDVLEQEIRYTFARSSGPGGQNVNKVNSKAVLWWSVADSKVWNGDLDAMNRFQQMFGNKINKEGLLVLTSQSERDQLSNKMDCLEKLKNMVSKALVPPPERIIPQPTMSGGSKRIFDKKANKQRKERRSFTPDHE